MPVAAEELKYIKNLDYPCIFSDRCDIYNGVRQYFTSKMAGNIIMGKKTWQSATVTHDYGRYFHDKGGRVVRFSPATDIYIYLNTK